MKKIFSYIGIISLFMFSFYFTERLALFMNKEDVLMKEITTYAEKNNKYCKEGNITSEGVVLGVNGKVVDEKASYSEMQFIGFDEKLMKYVDDSCIVTKENNLKDYIISGNSYKNSVSVIVNITTGKNLNKIINISNNKNIKLSLAINKSNYEDNKNYIDSLINSGYDILYKGKSSGLMDFKKIYNNTFNCININDDDLINECRKNKINTIKTNSYYKKDYYINIKSSLEKGKFYVLEESTELSEELGIIINYIKSRGYDILNINNHISS